MTGEKTFLYGTRAVMEAIHAGRELDKILVQKNLNNPLIRDLLALARENLVPIQRVPGQKLNRYTRKNHQGVICLLSAISYGSLDHIVSQCFSEGRIPLIVMLDRITDVRNFGAIARTADAASVDALVVQLTGHAQITGDAIKTSAGALNHLPVCRVGSLKRCIKELQHSGLQVVACSEKAKQLMYSADLQVPTVVLMGSEQNGISRELLESCNQHVRIPMTGKISSLNVSVATALVLYECVRQRLNL
ncbi:MAG: 23S rRNA (guanosine(2251)-2'-O)-methyltransferase RlmB [Cyclobacteriaceae bacterium]|nr:MAG: 23S rRNA (guanosine(2251)-2'-O)-methyltransferase RlmB [Cyclobacteriaceae bacterium]